MRIITRRLMKTYFQYSNNSANSTIKDNHHGSINGDDYKSDDIISNIVSKIISKTNIITN